MKNSSIVTCDELQMITGYSRPADISRTLREQGIKVFVGRNGPWTTLDLINSAGGLHAAANNEAYSPNIL